MLADLTVKDFLDKVAGNDPVPGGGSIAALGGALASALATMVTRLTICKKGSQASEEVRQHAETITTRFQKECIALIDKDSEAYDEVFACFKLPKANDEEKAVRSAAIQEATRHAALIPMEVARKALEVMPVIADIARLGNRNAITDACVAMMAARSAVLGALLNVRINLGVLKDKEFVQGLQAEADRIEQTACRKEKELLDAVNQDLRV